MVQKLLLMAKRTFFYHATFCVFYTVITRLEISKLNAEIEKIDHDAFVVMNSVKDTKGGMIKKRSFSH